jgi:hypothetical protein
MEALESAAMSPSPSSTSERRAPRRRFVLRAPPLAVLLIVGGRLLALETSGTVAQLGYLVLMAGVGLAVALVPLFFDHNPISKG